MMKKQPNILIFLADQHRGNTIGPDSKAYTPNIDAFMKEGVTFAQSHTTAPHCCPSRASLFSGLYPTEHGSWNNVNVGNALTRGLYDGVTLFPEDLQKAGYRTYYMGKWHISSYEGPCHRGFDYFDGKDGHPYSGKDSNPVPTDEKAWTTYKKYVPADHREEGQIVRNGYPTFTQYKVVKDEDFGNENLEASLEMLNDRAKFDKENGIDGGDRPWLHVMNFGTTHDPYFVPEKYLEHYNIDDIELPKSYYEDMMEDKPALYRRTMDRFRQLPEAEYKRSLMHYYASCTILDEYFGRALEALEASGEAENTVVLYISDHGDYTGDHGLWVKGLPCFEGAYHIPTVIRFPKGIVEPNRTVEDFTSITDIAPTLLELAGVSYERKMAGTSLVPYLKNETPEKVQTELFTQSNGNELYGIQRSVRTKEWKYVYNGFDYDEFYDLTKDPDEIHNLFNEYKDSELLKEMSKKMWQFAKDNSDVCINGYIMTALSSYGPGILFE